MMCKWSGGCGEAKDRIDELEAAIRRMIDASDNSGGSASDAIQDMLDIAFEALGEER